MDFKLLGTDSRLLRDYRFQGWMGEAAGSPRFTVGFLIIGRSGNRLPWLGL